MVHYISSPAKKSQSSPKKETRMESILGSRGANLFNTPVQNGNGSAGHCTPSNSMGTPVPPGTRKMSVLFNKQNNEVKNGYFGKLEFLDSQEKFEKTFGDKPTTPPPKPVSQDSSTVAKVCMHTVRSVSWTYFSICVGNTIWVTTSWIIL